jgi:threonine aldolase
VNFASDNAYGVSAPILDAITRANEGAARAYGADEITKRVEAGFAALFEREVGVFLVATGTAANALALSAVTPPYGAVLCHEEAHINVDECGAPEFFTGGAKLVTLHGEGAKIAPESLTAALDGLTPGNPHQVQAAALSLSQASECGLVYSPQEVRALAGIAHARGMAVHMDGARFANAVAGLGVSPAEITWRAGVDVLGFGATKNGALAAEAVIVFDKARAEELMFRRKRGGHLWSKGRFLAAQIEAHLQDGHWLDCARHANAMAQTLADGIRRSNVARLAWPVQANEVFPILPRTVHERLQAEGFVYYEWPGTQPADGKIGPDEVMVRFVTSFATREADVERLLRTLRAG